MTVTLENLTKKSFPTRKDEMWKYSDIGYLQKEKFQIADSATLPAIKEMLPNAIKLIFINGHFAQSIFDASLLPDNVTFSANQPANLAANLHENYFTAINAELPQQGIYLHVPTNLSVQPIFHCLFLTTQSSVLNNYRHKIILSKNSRATIFAEYLSESDAHNYLTNEVLEIELQENAELHYYKFQQESNVATHVAHTVIQQNSNSQLNMYAISKGARYARENLTANLLGSQARCALHGFYHVANDQQQSENYVRVNHQASHTTSDMHYKGIADKKARAVFNGKIYVTSHVQKIQADQSNHNLLLSNSAEINTKPEFEIYADDVKCKHGATVGQIDEEALFYLRSRGIDQLTAMRLLTQAFATSVLEQIPSSDVKHYILNLLK